MTRLFFLALLAVLTAETFPAQTSYRTIYRFGKSPDGSDSNASLVIGPQGSLFGTTAGGGEYGYGTVFELSNPTGTAWTETVLHSFSTNPDGAYPEANVIFGPGGALYGTTEVGGSGGGTVFELAPPTAPGGQWTESVLFAFASSIYAQVNGPYSAVLFGSDGLLYATAAGAFTPAGGVVALRPPADSGGTWDENTIFKFGTPPTAGWAPWAGLVADGGQLYGTNYYGGDEFGGCVVGDCGTVFELIPPSAPGSGWTATPIYEFTAAPSGSYPMAPLTVGNGGVLYGTTLLGGSGVTYCSSFAFGCGTVFQLTPPSVPGGTWTESILYSFTGVDGDGADPHSAVILGPNGQLYGTTQYGGDTSASSPCPASYNYPAGCGTVFELMPPAAPGGTWTETILHSFTGLDGDGAIPIAGLVMSSSGVLYGTTSSGGADGRGTAFAIKP